MNYTVTIVLQESRCEKCHRYFMAEKWVVRCGMCAEEHIKHLREMIEKRPIEP